VALALIVKRYTFPPSLAMNQSTAQRALRTALIVAICGTSIGLGLAYNLDSRYWVYLIIIGIHIVLTVALHVLVKQAPKPDYTSPLFPYVSAPSPPPPAKRCCARTARAPRRARAVRRPSLPPKRRPSAPLCRAPLPVAASSSDAAAASFQPQQPPGPCARHHPAVPQPPKNAGAC
jgi:hypothetical protein